MCTHKSCLMLGICNMTYLQMGQISQDLVILLVHAQRVLVALDGLIIVQVRPVDQPAVHKHLKQICQSLTLTGSLSRRTHVCHIKLGMSLLQGFQRVQLAGQL